MPRNDAQRCLLSALLVLMAPAALAFPDKPIRIVTSFPAGSVTDIMARPIAARMQEALGQPVIVENRPGAGGSLAAEHVAKSPADGYTLLMGTAGSNAINASLYRKINYDTLKDFAPVSMTATTYLLLVTHPSLPVKTVKELIALAVARPGQLNYGSGGSGSTPHLAGALFNSMTGSRMTHVPYKGSPQSTIDLLAGRVDLIFASVAPVLPHVETGRLRMIATTSEVRVPELPKVPTIAESGVPGYELMPWYGLFVPAGTPRPIVERLNAEIVRILTLPEVKTTYANAGLTATSSTPDAFSKLVVREFQKWSKLIAATRIVAD